MMQVIINSVLLIVWILYSILEGRREAFYYQAISQLNVKRQDLHLLFSIQRGLVLLLILLMTQNLVLITALTLMFPFIHDGSYYYTYNTIDPNTYKERFKSSSTTSTAIFEFSYKERCIFLILSIPTLLLSYLYNGVF